MDPQLVAGLACALGLALTVVGAVVWAYSAGRSSETDAATERAGRVAAEQALAQRLLAECQGQRDAALAEVEQLRRLAAARAQGADVDMAARAKLEAAARGAPGDRGAGGVDLGVLLDAVAPASGGDPRPGPAAATHAGGIVGPVA